MAVETESVARSVQYSGRAHADALAWRVDLVLGPSRIAEAALAAAGAGTLAVVLASAVPWWAHAVLVALVAVATVRALRRHGGREGEGAVRRLVVELDGRVEVQFATGRRAAGALTEGSFVAPWLTVVRWLPEGARLSRTVLVLPDAVEEGAFRRLRVVLRCGIIPP